MILGSNSFGSTRCLTIYGMSFISFSSDVPFNNGEFSINCNSAHPTNLTESCAKYDDISRPLVHHIACYDEDEEDE